MRTKRWTRRTRSRRADLCCVTFSPSVIAIVRGASVVAHRNRSHRTGCASQRSVSPSSRLRHPSPLTQGEGNEPGGSRAWVRSDPKTHAKAQRRKEDRQVRDPLRSKPSIGRKEPVPFAWKPVASCPDHHSPLAHGLVGAALLPKIALSFLSLCVFAPLRGP